MFGKQRPHLPLEELDPLGRMPGTQIETVVGAQHWSRRNADKHKRQHPAHHAAGVLGYPLHAVAIPIPIPMN
jgi:hypothetical protein